MKVPRMSKTELMELIDKLGLTTEYYIPDGAQEGMFKVTLTHPYILTYEWDRLQKEIKGDALVSNRGKQ